MRPLARVLVDEAHRQAWTIRPELAAVMSPGNPADASYAAAAHTLTQAGFAVVAHIDGPLTPALLSEFDVVVLPHASQDEWEATTGSGAPIYAPDEVDALEGFVREGGGLVILAECEQPKYGNSLGEIAARFGVNIINCTVQDARHRFHDVSTWVMVRPEPAADVDVFAGVQQACLYRAGALAADDSALVFARSHDTASPANAALIVGASAGAGRVVVVSDSDFAGDDSIDDLDHRALWLNLVTWATSHRGHSTSPAIASAIAASTAWADLKDAVTRLQALQGADGAVIGDVASARALVDRILVAMEEASRLLPHQAAYLRASAKDLQGWADAGFDVPDFLDSLMLFRPEQPRTNGAEHLAVFPMYTQNGSRERKMEAVIIRTVWPEWIARLEATAYDNAAFVPIEFVDFTSGYDTHSAVFFPETVATRETAAFTWGGIFCDREAARFRHVTRAAAQSLRLALPPDVEMLLADQDLAQQTFVLWDLVHDRTHSRGELPFDPFMIKQRMPFWMYALEELRCDLATFRETARLEASGVVLARHVRLAILLDRLFRFPTTGERVRNYDALAGQIVFAWLHQHGVVRWSDNTLTIEWDRCQDVMDELCEQVEELYRRGIERSRLGHWIAAHDFVSTLVPPHPASVWALGGAALPADAKEAVDAVLPDEFPLNVFYEALRRSLAPVIESARGITGAAA